jgi:hypothetical protein
MLSRQAAVLFARKYVAAGACSPQVVLIFAPDGEVAEWPNVPDSKSGVGVSLPRVRIPPSPPGHRLQTICTKNEHPAQRLVLRGFSFKPPDFGNLVRFFKRLFLRENFCVVGGFRVGVCFGFVRYAITKYLVGEETIKKHWPGISVPRKALSDAPLPQDSRNALLFCLWLLHSRALAMPRFSSVFDPRVVLVLLARAFVKVDLFGGHSVDQS